LPKQVKAIFFNELATTVSLKRRIGTLTANLFAKQTCDQPLTEWHAMAKARPDNVSSVFKNEVK